MARVSLPLSLPFSVAARSSASQCKLKLVLVSLIWSGFPAMMTLYWSKRKRAASEFGVVRRSGASAHPCFIFCRLSSS